MADSKCNWRKTYAVRTEQGERARVNSAEKRIKQNKDKREKPAPSELFDWDRAIKATRKILNDVYSDVPQGVCLSAGIKHETVEYKPDPKYTRKLI